MLKVRDYEDDQHTEVSNDKWKTTKISLESHHLFSP